MYNSIYRLVEIIHNNGNDRSEKSFSSLHWFSFNENLGDNNAPYGYKTLFYMMVPYFHSRSLFHIMVFTSMICSTVSPKYILTQLLAASVLIQVWLFFVFELVMWEKKYCGINIHHCCVRCLAGILEKIDHFQYLNIKSVWIGPVYRSPMRDFGYDVEDFRAIDPLFGTMDDFEELLAEMHSKGVYFHGSKSDGGSSHVFLGGRSVESLVHVFDSY